jgi:hypothetical protein
VAGQAVCTATKRGDFLKRLPREARPLVEVLYEELDGLLALQRRANKGMLDEAKRHAEYRLVRSCPGLGPVRSAELLPRPV